MIKRTVTGTEVVTTEKAKQYMRVDYDDHDTLIGDIVTSAREALEKYLGVSVIGATVEILVNDPEIPYYLPYGPVNKFTTFKVDDVDAEGPEDGVVRTDAEKIEATYTAGYDVIPMPLKLAIYSLTKKWYDDTEFIGTIPNEVKLLIEPYNRNLML